MILPDCCEESFRHLLLGHWNFKADRASRIPQTIQMFAKPKNTPIIKTNPLENSVAVQEAVVEHGNFRVRFGVTFSVNVNLRALDAHRGGAWTTFNCRFNCRFCVMLVNVGFV